MSQVDRNIKDVLEWCGNFVTVWPSWFADIIEYGTNNNSAGVWHQKGMGLQHFIPINNIKEASQFQNFLYSTGGFKTKRAWVRAIAVPILVLMGITTLVSIFGVLQAVFMGHTVLGMALAIAAILFVSSSQLEKILWLWDYRSL